MSHTKPVAMATPTEYFLGLIFTPALAPPNGTSGTEAAVRDVVLVLMSAEVSQVCGWYTCEVVLAVSCPYTVSENQHFQ